MGNYKQISIEERSVIQAQLTLGFKPSWIAATAHLQGFTQCVLSGIGQYVVA